MEPTGEDPVIFCVKVYCLQEQMEDQTEVNVVQPFKMSRVHGRDLSLCFRPNSGQLCVEDENQIPLLLLPFSEAVDFCQVAAQSFIVTLEENSFIFQFKTSSDMRSFQQHLRRRVNREGDRKGNKETGLRRVLRPEINCLQFHSLSQRQNLLQDHSRTATYHRAILLNEADFQDKVVLDVGGSGILSFFAVQAGAARVYSLQSGLLLKNTQSLVEANGLCGRIVVLDGDLCPEKVDVLLFEPTGHLLLSEPLSQTQLLKGRSCLKPAGLMFPSWADLHFAPFSDEQLYFENYARAAFWQQRNFYGINLNSLHNPAVEEFFRQPIVETFDAQILMSHSVKHLINFEKATAEDLQRFHIPFKFSLLQSGLVHGLAFWFDMAFKGSKATVWLSTAPTEPVTRWSQVRCLFHTPLFAKMGQTLTGTVHLISKNRESYDIHISATIDQSGFSSGNILELKNPFFRMPSWFHS